MKPDNTSSVVTLKVNNSPEVTAYVIIAILAMLKTGARMGTREIVEKLMREHGVRCSMRTVQRHLARLVQMFPIESDNAKPRGYSWAKTERAAEIKELATMLREAA